MAWVALHSAHGKSSRVTVGAGPTIMKRSDWTNTLKGDDSDDTNFESGGNEEGQVGITVIEWTLKGLWDLAQNPIDDPPGFYPRNDLSLLKFYPSQPTASLFNLLTVARVLSVAINANVKQNLTVDASGKSQGPYTVATGSPG